MFVVVFLYVPASKGAYLTPRQPKGVRWVGGGAGSHKGPPLLPIGRLVVSSDSQPHGYALLIAIRIRVKEPTLL